MNTLRNNPIRTPSRSSWVAGCVAFAFLCAGPRIAEAQDDEAVQAIFDQGLALLERHDYTAACPKLEEVARLRPGKVGAMLALADCYERAGRVASAWKAYRAAADRAGVLNDARAAEIRAKVDTLAPKLPRLRVQVGAATRALPGLEVKRDGLAIGAVQWGVPTPVDPGEYVIAAQAPGYEPLRVVVKIKERETKDAEVALKPASPDVASKPASPDAAPSVPPPVGEASGSSQRTAGVVVVVLGAAGLGVGGILGIVTKLKVNNATATSACTGPATLPNVNGCNGLLDAARGFQTAGIVTAILGGVAVGSGVALIVTAPAADKQTGSVAVVVHPTGVSLALRF